MTFKTLEARYNERVSQLYEGATTKWEGGKEGGGFNADPLMPRRPGNGYFGFPDKLLGRALPTLSAIQDTLRMVKYTASIRGLIGFLAKQQLLQSGNTFQTTRLINPAFHILAAGLPGIGNVLRVRRHWSPRLTPQGLLPTFKQDAHTVNVKQFGQLQVSTATEVLRRYTDKYKINNPLTIGQKIKNFLSPVTTLFGLGGKPNMGWTDGSKFLSIGSKHNPEGTTWNISRPELLENSIVQQNIEDNPRKTQFATPRFIIPKTRQQGAPADGLRYEIHGQRAPQYIPLKAIRDIVIPRFGPVMVDGDLDISDKMFTAGSDPSNAKQLSHTQAKNKNIKFPYDALNDTFDDFIDVTFAMGRGEPVKFRAFIKDVQQSSSPQYKEYQYIGRTEKFISYTGVQREVSFKLSVVALSAPELKNVWKRINYLTGLVFPYSISNGIYQPNIVRMTIGKLYMDQPIYVTSLNTNFSEVLESWDVGEQIPMSAMIDIKCILIEKTQKIANSPFYGINEEQFNTEYDARLAATGEVPASAAPDVNGFGLAGQYAADAVLAQQAFLDFLAYGTPPIPPQPAQAANPNAQPAGINGANAKPAESPSGTTGADGVTRSTPQTAPNPAPRSNENMVRSRKELIMWLQTKTACKLIDGIVGPETRPKVVAFQKDSNNTDAKGQPLKVDGIVGPRTTEALQKAYNKEWNDAMDKINDDINAATAQIGSDLAAAEEGERQRKLQEILARDFKGGPVNVSQN